MRSLAGDGNDTSERAPEPNHPDPSSKRTIRVIGAGLGRTGTKSLQAALDILGYRTYHFVLPSHAKTWADCSNGNRTIDEALDLVVQSGYDATCDQPTADVFADQVRLYPDAKVVLTMRDDAHRWASSWKVLMGFIEVQERPFSLWYPSFLQWIPFMRNWKVMRSMMGAQLGLKPGELIRGWRNKPPGWLEEQYEAHNDLVKATVPPERLLVFNVKEGWKPLCEFLGMDAPNEDETPFPFVNESKDLEIAKKVMICVTYGWIPCLVAVGSSLGFVGLKLWGSLIAGKWSGTKE